MEDYRQATVVLTGSFNPAIFYPEWFREQEILPEIEVSSAESATDLVITRQATVIRFMSLRLEALGERWTLTSERPDWFKDLGPITTSIFDKLPHTPVKALTMTFLEHRRVRRSPAEAIEGWLTAPAFGKVVGNSAKLGVIGRGEWEKFETALVLEHSVRLKGAVFIGQSYELKLKTARDLEAVKWADLITRSNEVSRILLEEKGQ